MHPQRWGDPAAAAPCPTSARGLVELAFGGSDDAAVAASAGCPLAGAPWTRRCSTGCARSSVPSTSSPTPRPGRLRTRGKSTPDLLRARAGDLTDAPDVVVRPGRPARGRGAAGLRRRAPPRGRALRRRHVGHRRAGRAPGGLRRRGQPRPGAARPAGRGRPRVDDRDPRARAARTAGRGAARRARTDARATTRSRSSTPRSAASPPPGPAASPARATAASTRSSSASPS